MNTITTEQSIIPSVQSEIHRLRRLYILALGAIACIAIVGQITIQYVLRNDETNSRIINIAGRQRMLSQKLCKLSLQLAFVENPPTIATLKEFQFSLALWKQSHYALQYGDEALQLPSGKNSPRVQEMFTTTEPVFRSMDSLCQALIVSVRLPKKLSTFVSREQGQYQAESASQSQTHLLLARANTFLQHMNTIVVQYDEEFHAAVRRLQLLEGMLFFLTLLTLALEAVFVFRPAVQHLQQFVETSGQKNTELYENNSMLSQQQNVLEVQAMELETINTHVQEQNIELERHRQALQGQMFEMETLYCELQEARRSQTEFLMNLSHELRTPMSSIIGFTEILLQDFVLEEGQPFGKRILRSANVLLVMLNDLIDLAYLEAGQFDLHRELQPLEPVIAEICDMMTFEANSKHLSLQYIIAPEVPSMLAFDARRLRQIFFNLLSNAIKFTERGGITFKTLFNTATKTLRFEIQDTGIGIAPEHRERVFERFVQQDASSVRKYGGNGVGLALVKRIVELKGGQIWLESELGKGTTVIVELPRE